MPDVPGTTLNSMPDLVTWLGQLFQNQTVRPPVLPFAANTNIDPAWRAAEEKYRTPAVVTPLGEVGAYDSVKGVGDPRGRQLTPAEMMGGLPLMAPPMVGHPVGLRERERSILDRFENE